MVTYRKIESSHTALQYKCCLISTAIYYWFNTLGLYQPFGPYDQGPHEGWAEGAFTTPPFAGIKK